MAEHQPRSNWIERKRGPVLLTISAVLFAAMAVFVRMAGYRNIPGAETTLVRFLLGLVTVISMHLFGFTRLVIRRPGWLAARGITGGLAILFYFLSLSAAHGRGATTLTNSVLLGNSYFVFVPLFGPIIGERLRASTLAAVLVAFAGMYLVVSPSFGGIRLGDVYGLASGFTAGLAIITVRELRRTELAPVVFFSLCAFGTIIAAGTLAAEGAAIPDALGWWILAGMAVTATAGQLIMTHAFRYIPAGEGSLIAMTAVVYSSLVGILVFREPFTVKVAAGAVLVLASAGYLGLTYEAEGV